MPNSLTNVASATRFPASLILVFSGKFPTFDAAPFCLTILLWPSHGYDLNEAGPSRTVHKAPAATGSHAPIHATLASRMPRWLGRRRVAIAWKAQRPRSLKDG